MQLFLGKTLTKLRAPVLGTKQQRERMYRLKNKYGLTEETFDALLSHQGGMCPICKTTQPGGHWGRFVVDHCHATGKIRGILCSRCNVALGHVNDSAETALAMALYLERHAK